MSWMKRRAGAIAREYVGEFDGDEEDVYLVMVSDIERVALEFAERACVALWNDTDDVSHFCMPDMAPIFAAADKDDVY